MRHTGRVLSSVRAVAVALAVTASLAACGGGDDPAPAPTASTPAGFELPEGVELSAPGSTVDVGDPATFVYEVGDGASSAVTATVTKITKGSIKDFAFFSLDKTAKASTPYYVRATLTNEGPAGLGGAAPPFVLRDDANTVAPPNSITGTFRPCGRRTLPASFLPGATAKVCMVFLVPKGRSLVSVDSLSDDTGAAVRWKR